MNKMYKVFGHIFGRDDRDSSTADS